MLEVCFGDSECGILKYGLQADMKDVIYSYTDLELGKIATANFDVEREQWIDRFFSSCSRRTRAKIKQEEKKRFSKIMDAAKKGRALRIWHASSPYSKCGYYHLIFNLQGMDCRVFAVEMPKDAGYRREIEGCDNSWGEVDARDIEKFTSLTVELSKEERAAIATKWAKLSEENADLRLNVGGELTSVSEDYLDDVILGFAPDGEYEFIKHIANCLVYCPHSLKDSFFADRIEHFIDSGKLEVVKSAKKGEEYYTKTILKKV